jgi:AcrR family transcriptional regulator
MSKVQRRRKGIATRAAILDAAKELLLEEGYGRFVFRSVAKRAGVEPGNVQYYFASKNDLIRGVLVTELESYEERLENAVRRGRTKTEQVDLMVDWLGVDLTDHDSLRLWLAIWGMAAYDEELGGIVRAWYQAYIKTFSGLLQKIFPQLGNTRAMEAATTITAQFDGLMIVLLLGGPDPKIMADVTNNINTIIDKIIEACSDS